MTRHQREVFLQCFGGDRQPEEAALFALAEDVRPWGVDLGTRCCVYEQILGQQAEYRTSGFKFSTYFRDSWGDAGWIAWCHQFGPAYAAGGQTAEEALTRLKSRIAAGERPVNWDGYFMIALGKVYP